MFGAPINTIIVPFMFAAPIIIVSITNYYKLQLTKYYYFKSLFLYNVYYLLKCLLFTTHPLFPFCYGVTIVFNIFYPN